MKNSIVLTFGTIQHQIGLASLAALAAVLLVAIAGFTLRKPLARVPENTMKFVVGIMLISFGIFWGVEGAGTKWPGSDLSLLAIITFMTLLSLGLVSALHARRQRQLVLVLLQAPALSGSPEEIIPEPSGEDELEVLRSRTFAKSVKAFILTSSLNMPSGTSWWIVPVAVATLLPYSLLRVTRVQ